MKKPLYSLKKDDSITGTLNNIFTTELNFLSEAVNFVIQDGDPENLHDFRVVLRRLRGIIRLFKQYINEDRFDEVTLILKELFNKTSELRDYDIFLGNISQYSKEFPAFQKTLSVIKKSILIERKNYFKKFKAFVQNGSFKTTVEKISEISQKDFFNHTTETTEDALKKVLKVTLKKVSSSLPHKKKILLDDTRLHDLRIRLKKVRYLFDIFCSLFNSKKYESYIKHLKIIQDLLGINQDLYFQLNFITNYEIELSSNLDEIKQFIINQKHENMVEFVSRYEELKKILSVNKYGRLLK